MMLKQKAQMFRFLFLYFSNYKIVSDKLNDISAEKKGRTIEI